MDLNDPLHIVAVTRDVSYVIPPGNGKETRRYVVTAVDRFHNESRGRRIKVKL
jgi:hypothetical protein